MKPLIVYYSFTRNNELLAKHLRQKMQCDILRIEEEHGRNGFTIVLDLLFNRKPSLKSYGINLNEYNYFVFVSPIWAGKVASPLKSFLIKEKAFIKQFSYISACGGREGQRDKIGNELSSLLNRKPDVVAELWINDLLPENQKDTVKYTTAFRVQPKDLDFFSQDIEKFIKEINAVADPVAR